MDTHFRSITRLGSCVQEMIGGQEDDMYRCGMREVWSVRVHRTKRGDLLQVKCTSFGRKKTDGWACWPEACWSEGSTDRDDC